MEWFWDRLAKSVKAPLDPEPHRHRSSLESSSSSGQLSSMSSSHSSNSVSSMDTYHIPCDSLRNAQQQFEDFTSLSSMDSGCQSMSLGRSASHPGESSHECSIEDSSFASQYVQISTDISGPSRSQGKKSKNIFGQVKKVFTKKNNNTNSSA